MSLTTDKMDDFARGPVGMVDVQNELFNVHNPLDITDITPTPVLIAALGLPGVDPLSSSRATALVRAAARITSYNVCYTKLLR